ncbi:MAG: sugar ABC transporter ATP-binding protein [Hyphomicrobiales bacterium]|nr:sugar ABC transporter ATP-binding protein [Hyphomicrobiales bacterium]
MSDSAANSEPDHPFLSVRDIHKSYGGLKAIDGVDLDIQSGEIVALVGDNGAGKSTLIKMLCGALRPDGGELRLRGVPIEFASPKDATDSGIETVHQSLGLVDTLTVPENVFLGREETFRVFGLFRQLDRAKMRSETRGLLERFGISVPTLNEPVIKLSGGQRQTIAISRLLLSEPSLLIMDEPMAALGVDEGRRVMELVSSLRDKGIAILMISHNLEHVFQIADRVVVLKNGRLVGAKRTGDTTRESVVAMITLGTA